MPKDHTYYVYILTNPGKTVLYIGVTNNLTRRLKEHYEKRGTERSFTGRYSCYQLIFYEVYQYINDAITREKQLKRWSRIKKETLINTENPKWNFLNAEFRKIEDY